MLLNIVFIHKGLDKVTAISKNISILWQNL